MTRLPFYTMSISIKQNNKNEFDLNKLAIVDFKNKNNYVFEDVTIKSFGALLLSCLCDSECTKVIFLNDFNLLSSYINASLQKMGIPRVEKTDDLTRKKEKVSSTGEKIKDADGNQLYDPAPRMAYTFYEGAFFKIKLHIDAVKQFNPEKNKDDVIIPGGKYCFIISNLMNITRKNLHDCMIDYKGIKTSTKLDDDSVLDFSNVMSETLQDDDGNEPLKQAFAMSSVLGALLKIKEMNINSDNLTLATIAIQDWASMVEPESYRIIEDKNHRQRKLKENLGFGLEKIKLNTKLVEKFRQAYHGGILWVNDKYENKYTGPGLVLDVNSFFSYIMSEYPMPYGIPKKSMYPDEEWTNDDVYYIGHFDIQNLNLDYIPCIYDATKNIVDGDITRTTDTENLNGWLTNYDIKNIKQNYNTKYKDYEFHCDELYVFETKENMFTSYINKWFERKKKSKNAEREVNKLFLETLYGRFGVLVSNSFNYCPISIFVTSISRYLICADAITVFDKVIEVDTDGIHMVGDCVPDVVNEDGNAVFYIGDGLGQYKIEDTFSDSKYIGKRAYCHRSTKFGTDIFKICRVQDEIKKQFTWDNFGTGFTSDDYVIIKTDKEGHKYRTKTRYELKM